MERLTEKHYLGTDHYMKCSGNCNVDMDCIDCPSFDRLVERLAAYEDTGLEPGICAEYKKFEDEIVASGKTFNHLIELLRAEKEGRVVVLPVRPVLTQSIESMLYIVEDGEIIEDSLCDAYIGMASSGKTNVVYTTLGDQVISGQADRGKSVSRAQEEAERVWKGGRDDNG